MPQNRKHTVIFRNPDIDFQTDANCTSDAIAIALEHTGCPVSALVKVRQPDPDDPFNPDSFISLAGAALDIWLES